MTNEAKRERTKRQANLKAALKHLRAAADKLDDADFLLGNGGIAEAIVSGIAIEVELEIERNNA